ncbi:MAG: Z1 domain-containing protein [Sporichthyaceae bacterium]
MSSDKATLGSLDRYVTADLLEPGGDTPTQESIRHLIDNLRILPKFHGVTDAEAEALARSLEARHSIRLTVGGVVQLPHQPWLPQSKASIDPYYWNRYRQLLAAKGLGVNVLATLDDVSDRIVGLMGDPKSAGGFDRRGLVLGNVQSGKTANYLGAICKAADAGYRVIIVIAGIHNNLRNQTQSRVDEGFIGFEKGTTKHKMGKVVGVGRFDTTRQPSHFTSSTRDFAKAAASQVGVPLQNLNEPAVFVIKKNATTLKNLIEWLQTSSRQAQIDSPLLIIDDEADNASINVSQDPAAVSRINSQIREILQMFSRSTYLGYTATPFANIFIDPETNDEMLGQDLFPRDFIVSLDAPSNYVGAKRVFLESEEQFVRSIEDSADVLPIGHKIDFALQELPGSLRGAVRGFLVARAIRILRGQDSAHNSMLVNASRFTRVQTQLRNHIHMYLEELKNALRVNGALPPDEAERSPDIAELKGTWRDEYAGAREFEWSQVLGTLHEAAASVSVVEVNSRSAGNLNYADFEQGMNVIAVGGFSLSRGLTLEGLTTTYFLRNSIMYDTLLQMGRWFGYRDGYDDVCRVWMLDGARGWYAHIAEAVEELRADLKEMEAAGAIPADYGLRVRSHPESLIVTARNKMRTGTKFTVSIGLAGTMIETTPLAVKHAKPNLDATRALIGRLAASSRLEEMAQGLLFRDVPCAEVDTYVEEFQGHPLALKTQAGPVLEYLRERQSSTLALWDVLVVSKDVPSFEAVLAEGNGERIAGLEIVYADRTAGSRSNAEAAHIGEKQKVASRGIEKVGLTTAERELAEATHREQSDGGSVPDHAYRSLRTRPMLVVQLTKLRQPEAKEDGEVSAPVPLPEELVAAWCISFPKTPVGVEEKRVSFVVNTIWLQEHFGADEDDEDMADVDG